MTFHLYKKVDVSKLLPCRLLMPSIFLDPLSLIASQQICKSTKYLSSLVCVCCVCVRMPVRMHVRVHTNREQYNHHIGCRIVQLDFNVQYVCLWPILDHASPDVRQVIERNLEAGVFGSTHVSSRWDPVSESQVWEEDPVDISPPLVGFSSPRDQGTDGLLL